MTRLKLGIAALAACLCMLPLVPAAPALAAGTFPPDVMLFDANNTANGNYEIFQGTTSGGPAKQLTNDPAYDTMWPRIAPGNGRILFQRTRKGDHDTNLRFSSVWTMNADGSGLTEIIGPREYGWTYLWHPEWSPDGTEIVMLAGATAAKSNLVITTSSGDDPRNVLPPNSAPGTGTSWDPAWSFDGRWIVFAGCYGLLTGNGLCPASFGSDIYKVHPDGTGLTRVSRDALFPAFDPYISPDGTKIVFIQARTGTSSPAAYSLGLVHSNGSATSDVINDGGANSRVAWAADSKTLYFHRRPLTATTLSFSIWRIQDNGKRLTQLYPAPAANPLAQLLNGSTFSFEFPAVAWPS